MLEERRSERVRSILRATIRFYDRNRTMDCIVRSISLSGARLELDQTLVLPEEFELAIPQRGAMLQCQLKWRTKAAVGIRFKSQTATTQNEDISTESIEALQRRNAALCLKIARLTVLVQKLESPGQEGRKR